MRSIVSNNVKKTTEQFVQSLIDTFGNQCDYSTVQYNGAYDKVTIVCPVHGEFTKVPHGILKAKQCCPKCSRKICSTANLYSTETFVDKAIAVHGDIYTYGNTNYVISNKKVYITCRVHGDFKQSPSSHLQGIGCPKCGIERTKQHLNKSASAFIQDAIRIHGDKYDYSNVDYVNSHTKIQVGCTEHGMFETLPYNHLNGFGCNACGIELGSSKIRIPYQEFIRRSNCVHDNLYEYDESSYSMISEKICIKCKKHGWFVQRGSDHINQKHGCPFCTKKQTQYNVYKTISNLTDSQTISDYRHGKYEIDVYLPDFNLGIEYNGLYWHSDKFLSNSYHIDKSNYFKQIGIRIIHIFEDEWRDKQNIILSILNYSLKNSTNKRVFARNTLCRPITSRQANDFIDTNHVQGIAHGSIRYGLYDGNELVSVMTFCKPRRATGFKFSDTGEYELLRFCNKLNTIVVGGASKLYKRFITDINPLYVFAYANKRYFDGNLYNELGMQFESSTPPNYFYTKHGKRYNRFAFRKDILVINGYESRLTEKQIMTNRNYYRVYDCGTNKFSIRY